MGPTPSVDTVYDTIVVGAGAAGCVLASRLSEDPAHRVLLLEAGDDMVPGAEPADVRDTYPASYFNKRYFWPGLGAWWTREGETTRTGFSQARVLGGGGAVMGMVGLRGLPSDYADWEAAGARGWGWDGVLPFFRRLENDQDFQGPLHGADGPVPVRRLPRAGWTPMGMAVARWAASRGMPEVADMNADFRDGCGTVPITATPEERASSAFCYLTQAVRARGNLTVATGVHATRVLFDGRQAVGVEVLVGGQLLRFAARRVVLSAGGVFSPALLLRSGIGPEVDLRALGVPVVAHRPGVGAGLQNHPVLYIGLHLKRHARQAESLRPSAVNCLRYSSGVAGCPAGDQYLNVQSKTSWHVLGRQIGNVSTVLLRPYSRGSVRLLSPDPLAAPRVEFNFLSDPRDQARLAHGFTQAAAFALHCAAEGLSGQPFPVRFGDRLRRLNETSTANAARAALLAGLLDTVPPLGRRLLARLAGEGTDLAQLCADPAALQAHVRSQVAGLFHPASSCAMGAADDATAVTGPDGAVHGVAGLHVADASVMPNLPSGNTNLPTLMVAEKIAEALAA